MLELKDSTANKNDIINGGYVDDLDAPAGLSGAVYSALADNGSDQMTVPDALSLRITGNLSIEWWVKVTSNTLANPGVRKTNGTSGYSAYMSGNEDPIFFITTAGANKGRYTNTNQNTLGVWEHWGFAYTAASSSMIICKNGTSLTLNNLNGGAPSSIPDTAGIDITFGNNGSNAVRFCDVRIWNVARTAAEFNANKGVFLDPKLNPNMVANWTFQPFVRPGGGNPIFMGNAGGFGLAG